MLQSGIYVSRGSVSTRVSFELCEAYIIHVSFVLRKCRRVLSF